MIRFVENSHGSDACPHPDIRYVVDAQWHTLACARCGKRWSRIGLRATPRYDEVGALLNPGPRDRRFPEDEVSTPIRK